MAMPVYFAPGYISPSRVKLEETFLKQQAVEQGLQGISEAFQKYIDNRKQAKLERLGMMQGMMATYGASALGQPFQDEVGKMFSSYGIDLPKEGDHYKIPDSFEGKMRQYIGAHPEMLPTLLGAQKPELSPGEKSLKEDELGLREQLIEARREADRLRYEQGISAIEGRLKGIEETVAGRKDVANIQQQGQDLRAQIAADSKRYGIDQTTLAHKYGVDAKTAVAVLGLDTKKVIAEWGITSKKDIAELQSTTKLTTTAMTTEAADRRTQANTQIAAARVAADPKYKPSGFYNYNGQIIPAGEYVGNPQKYPGAWEMNQGSYSMVLKDKRTAQMTQEDGIKFPIVINSLQQHAADEKLKPIIASLGLAVRNKNPRAQALYSNRLLTALNDTENWGLTDDEISKYSTQPGFMERIIDVFSGAANEIGASGPPPASAETPVPTPGAPQAPPGQPQKAPTLQPPSSYKLKDGTVVEIHPVQ